MSYSCNLQQRAAAFAANLGAVSRDPAKSDAMQLLERSRSNSALSPRSTSAIASASAAHGRGATHRAPPPIIDLHASCNYASKP